MLVHLKDNRGKDDEAGRHGWTDERNALALTLANHGHLQHMGFA